MPIRGIRKPIKGQTVIGRLGRTAGAPQELTIPSLASLLRSAGGGGIGSVSSVGLAAPVEFTVSGSPVTGSGTLTFGKATQSANRVWAGPATGAAAQPTFRALVTADIPAGLGYVVGPASAVDNSVPTYNSTTGKLIQDRAKVFIDSSGRLLTGNATAQTISGITGALEVLGTDSDTSAFVMARWSVANDAANLALAKANGATVGTNTIVANNNILGSVSFCGANGTTFNTFSAIQGYVDGVPGASNDSPGRLEFRVCADGSSSLTQAMTLKSNQHLLVGTTVDTQGTLQIGTNSDTTNAAGILWGTDVQAFRLAANVLEIPDQVTITTAAFTTPSATKSGLVLSAATNNPAIVCVDSTQTANNRMTLTQWGSGAMSYYLCNDAVNSVATYMKATGGQAAGISTLTFPDPVSNIFGHTASVTVTNAGKLQVTGTTSAGSQLQVSRFSADANGPNIVQSKSRSGTAGTNTIVQSGDVLAAWTGAGANGSAYTPAAQISFESDGTPGATNDMPGRMVGLTTPDGSGTLTESWRVGNDQKFVFQVDRPLRFNNQTSGAGASLGTLTNAPAVGDPTHWQKINVGGTNYTFPCWPG